MYEELARIRNRHLYRPDEVLAAIRWTKTLPWLYYPTGISTTALESDDIETELKFRGASSALTFVLATYTLSGTYLGLRPLELQLQVIRFPRAVVIKAICIGVHPGGLL